MINWDERIEGWIANSPLCACGCGKKVTVDWQRARDRRCRAYPYRPFIQGHNFRTVPELQLTARERSIVVGTLLGDGYCGYAHAKATMPRLVCSHGAKQAEWSEWKASELSRLNAKVKYVKNPGWGEQWARMETASHDSLKEFQALFYSPEGKAITNDILKQIDPLALAVWVGDDGSLQSDYSFHTEGFDLRSIDLLSGLLWKLGAENNVQPNGRGHHLIRTYRTGTRVIASLIAPHLPECMRYKLWQE